MDGERKTCALITVFLCLVTDYGWCSSILEGPRNLTVLTGADASFTCTVASGWQSVGWSLGNIDIVNITPMETIVSSVNLQISTRNSTNSVTGAFTSEITIINVNKNNSGTVTCRSISAPSQFAYLIVQVNGSVEITNGSVTVEPNTNVTMVCNASGWIPAPAITWKMNNTLASNLYYFTNYTGTDSSVTAISTFTLSPDGDMTLTCLASISTLAEPQSATVSVTVREQPLGSSSSLTQTDIILIAVFCSIGGLLLLIVIIAVIVLCCKKKDREASYQSDAWKAPEMNGSNLRRTTERDSFGEKNFGYTPEPTEIAQSVHYDNASTLVYNEVVHPPQERAYTPESRAYSPESRAYTPELRAYNPEARAYIPESRAYIPQARSYTPQVPVREWTDESLKQIRHVTHV